MVDPLVGAPVGDRVLGIVLVMHQCDRSHEREGGVRNKKGC